MKPVFVTLPLGAALACAGVWMLAIASHGSRPASSPNSGTDPLHPVTPSMTQAADKMTLKEAPGFSLQDSNGKTWTLDSLTNGKPLYMHFILDGCSCSTDAEPLFHQLYRQFKGEVNFVGVIASDKRVAAAWSKDHQMPYPLLADPTCKVIRAYHAKQAVYNVLVTPDHKIDHLWPGYSQDLMNDMNAHISEVLGVPAKPLDTLYAPLKKTSGCYFPAVKVLGETNALSDSTNGASRSKLPK